VELVVDKLALSTGYGSDAGDAADGNSDVDFNRSTARSARFNSKRN
jgi:hypothetical protein